MLAHVALELLDRIAFARLGRGLAQSIDDDGAHDFAEQLFLVREVQVDGAFGDAGTARDVVEPGAGEAALVEDLERGVEDLAWPFLGQAAPPRRRCVVARARLAAEVGV